MYTDWHRKVEEYIWKGYDDNRIKDAMLSSFEGQAYVNFRSCDEGRNRTPAQILKEMDSIYNVSVTFWDLNARMCGLKQGMNEPIKTYYERMVLKKDGGLRFCIDFRRLNSRTKKDAHPLPRMQETMESMVGA